MVKDDGSTTVGPSRCEVKARAAQVALSCQIKIGWPTSYRRAGQRYCACQNMRPGPGAPFGRAKSRWIHHPCRVQTFELAGASNAWRGAGNRSAYGGSDAPMTPLWAFSRRRPSCLLRGLSCSGWCIGGDPGIPVDADRLAAVAMVGASIVLARYDQGGYIEERRHTQKEIAAPPTGSRLPTPSIYRQRRDHKLT